MTAEPELTRGDATTAPLGDDGAVDVRGEDAVAAGARPLAVAVSGRGLVEPGEPVLAADDEGFTRGRAAFETMRVYGGRPFRFEQHVTRLVNSAARIGIAAPDRGEIEQLSELALAHAGAPDATLRLYWTPGPPGGSHCAIAIVGAIPAWIEDVRARGQRLVSLLHQRRSEPWMLPATKSTSYAVSMAAEAEAKARGADDAVFVDADGIVLEGPVTNIWWREGDILVTPSLEVGILAGETRAALLELAGREGRQVVEGVFPLERLLAADEVFTSSSVREIIPVIAVDETPFERGPAAAALQDALRRAARS
jgi:4-amino-4-deoxychorismate lyase